MSRRAVILAIIVIQTLAIAALAVSIASPKYAVSFAPLARKDIQMSTTSDRLRYYYDLSGEIGTFVPDWLPYTPEYERNSDRLNDRYEYAHGTQDGRYRILMLGDSWTFGLHVSTRDNYSEKLEDRLLAALSDGSLRCEGIEDFDVINLGLGGYDIEYMVESLRLRGMVYGPDLVIPLIKNDDFTVVNEIWQPRIAAYQEEYGNLEAKMVDGVVHNPRQEIAERVVDEISAEHTEKELNDRGIRSLEFVDTFYRGPMMLFVYAVSDAQRDMLASFARERKDTYVHIEPLLSPSEKVPLDEHPGVSGHARFADSLYNALIGTNVLPCAAF